MAVRECRWKASPNDHIGNPRANLNQWQVTDPVARHPHHSLADLTKLFYPPSAVKSASREASRFSA